MDRLILEGDVSGVLLQEDGVSAILLEGGQIIPATFIRTFPNGEGRDFPLTTSDIRAFPRK